MTYMKLLDEIRKLPREERMRLIDEIYDLDSDSEPIVLTPEQEAELDRRVALYKDKPEAWIPHEKVLAELDRKLAQK